jgi:hypothetical protein
MVTVCAVPIVSAADGVDSGAGAPWWLQYPVAAALVGVMVWMIRHYTGEQNARDKLFLDELKSQREAGAVRDEKIVDAMREGHDKLMEGLQRVGRDTSVILAHGAALSALASAAASGQDIKRLESIARDAVTEALSREHRRG